MQGQIRDSISAPVMLAFALLEAKCSISLTRLISFPVDNTLFVLQRNAELELKVIDWIESVLGERPLMSYESFIQDGKVIGR